MSMQLFFLHLEFIPIIFLIIYVGAVAVLFLFVVMMLNIKSLVFTEFKSFLPMGIFMSFIIILSIFYFLINDTVIENPTTGYLYLNIYNSNNIIYKLFLLRIWHISDLSSISLVFYNNNFLIFTLAAFILLVAMIGAIVLTLKNPEYRSNFEKYKKQKIAKQILRDLTLSFY
jgi:NADH-quinone oxidoreductase subunit J